MFIVFITSLMAFVLTFFESRGKIRHGMLWGFVMITTLGVIHYDYGNDYMAYFNIYNEITRFPFNFEQIINKELFKEPGWAILCYLFKNFGGFFAMVAVLNIIQNILVYRFIKSNVEKQWWSMAIFIYLFSTSLYLLNFSMMRQGFVVCVFLGIWNLVKNKKWWWALLILYLCTFIHTSAFVLLPFAFWGFIPNGHGKTWAIIYNVLLIFLWISGETLNALFISLMDVEEIKEYLEYYGDKQITKSYGIGFIMNILPFFVALYYLLTNKDTDKKQNIVLLSIISFIITPFAHIIPMIGRLSAYFSIFRLASIPIIYSSIKRKEIRFALITIFIAMTLYDYWLFFNNSVFAKSYSTFHTIFEEIL